MVINSFNFLIAFFVDRRGKEQSLTLSEHDAKGRVSNEIFLSMFLAFVYSTFNSMGYIYHI